MKQTTCTQVPKDITGACLNTRYSSQCKEALRGWWEHFCTRMSSSIPDGDFNLDVALQALYNMYMFQKRNTRWKECLYAHVLCEGRRKERCESRPLCCKATLIALEMLKKKWIGRLCASSGCSYLLCCGDVHLFDNPRAKRSGLFYSLVVISPACHAHFPPFHVLIASSKYTNSCTAQSNTFPCIIINDEQPVGHCMKWQVCGQHFRTQHDKDACEKQNNQAQALHVTQKLVPTLNKVYEPMRTHAMLLPGFCFCFSFWLIKNKDLWQRRILHYGALLQKMQTTLRAHNDF